MPFRIEWKASTRKDLRKLPERTLDRILESVEALMENPFPHGVEKLSGAERTYRIRIGDYRVVYEVETRSQLVEKGYPLGYYTTIGGLFHCFCPR